MVDLKEDIFETIADKYQDEITEEEFQEWMEATEKYHNTAVKGMHQGLDCDSVDDYCCDICGEGHHVIVMTSDGAASMVTCTKSGCGGPVL